MGDKKENAEKAREIKHDGKIWKKKQRTRTSQTRQNKRTRQKPKLSIRVWKE